MAKLHEASSPLYFDETDSILFVLITCGFCIDLYVTRAFLTKSMEGSFLQVLWVSYPKSSSQNGQ